MRLVKQRKRVSGKGRVEGLLDTRAVIPNLASGIHEYGAVSNSRLTDVSSVCTCFVFAISNFIAT